MALLRSFRLSAGSGVAALALAAVPAVAGPASASVPSCTFDHLRTSIARAEGAAGSVYLTLHFTNTGRSACTVYGHPGVSFYKGTDRHQVGLTAKRAADATPVVALAPGKAADAVLRITNALNYPSSTCRPRKVDGLRIIPPQHRSSAYLKFPTWACKNPVRTMTIFAVRKA